MAYELITLNLIPSGEVPVIHAAQYDTDRPLNFELKLGGDDFTISGYDLELQIRKVDNNIVTVAPASVSGNVVTFNSTEQMTACSGTNLGQIQITKDDLDIATLHFYLVVQRDVLAGGVNSESAIHNLTSQIADIVPQVIGDDYYDKDEVDALIAEHTFDPTNYYNKEEVDEKIAEIPTFDPTNYYDKSATDALLADKADVSDLPDMTNYYDKSATDALLDQKADVSDLPDMTNYYDKSATDALLDQKADVSDLPDMTNYYTKTEVDTKITDLYEIKTVSGSLVTLTDGGDNIPVSSFECEIGSAGFSQAEITVCGNNFVGFPNVDFTIANMRFYSDGTAIKLNGTSIAEISSINTNYKDNLAFTLPAGTYYASVNVPTGVGIYLRRYSDNALIDSTLPYTFTLTETTKIYWGFYIPNNKTLSDHNTQFNITIGDTATTYEAYIGTTYTVSFGSTFNDGALIYENGEWSIDVSGVITHISSSTRVKTISGVNNIFSNTGDCEVDYFTEKSDGIAELIKAFT